ncbi:MAG: prolyl oligopeptidase family serine peptidase [Bryobacteraceae bacterium]|jgi:dipeptidyl aminopeptidase/acylaminoacyl peptidase|nr:prolyl oligopeptidase family serine peptidase [Bryobacteraceae bacterium]
MNRRCALGLIAWALTLPLFGQLPPLLDRELFFGDPEISGAQISPDGRYIAFLKPWNGTRNIWVKKTEEPFTAARLVTADTKRPIPGYFWSRDARYILYVQDQAGDENYNVFAVDPAAAPPAGAPAPTARNLTDAKGVRAFIYAVPRSDPDIIYVGLNDRDKAWHDLYKVRISTGERTLLRQNTDRITLWVFDNKDQLRLAVRSAPNGDTEILRVESDGFRKIYSCDVFETCQPLRFHKDNQQVYIETNRGENLNLTQLALLDPETGVVRPVESDPENRVDLSGALFSDLTDELLATFYYDDKLRRYWKDKSYEADYKRIEQKLPGKEISIVSRTRDERLWLIAAQGDTEPGETYLFDRKSKRLTFQYRIREKLPRQYLAQMRPVRYRSSDGLEVPAYLTLPKGVEPKGLPAVVLPHGGPWARDTWGYRGLAQFLANRGYAVLQPNFRGSTGYGKQFLNAGNRQWGEKMQDDLTWGVKYLVAQGIADPKRVGILGGSYGGYATLAGVAFTPDLYAAAVALVAPSNLITLLDSIPPYWEAVRVMFYKRMGDPTTAEGRAQLERQSPLNAASKIKTPLLLIHGANDPRVKQRESDQIVVALRDRGFPVEYLVAPDEGHGFARPVNNMAAFAAAEKFLAKHLGGRYQEGGTPEVMARLKEITVDPRTVVLAKALEPEAVTAPVPAADLTPGSYKYAATIQAGERSIQLEIAGAITADGPSWTIVETMSTPMGEAVDTTVLDKKTLTLLRRSVKQGPVAIEVAFADNRLKGAMNAGGQQKAIDAEVGGPLFAHGAGGPFAIAALPLAEGYRTAFRNFDLQLQKVKLMQLQVTGAEKVAVPAGEFDAWRVEISSADGGPEKATLWVARDSRKPVKMTAVMPQMGGAVLTMELR